MMRLRFLLGTPAPWHIEGLPPMPPTPKTRLGSADIPKLNGENNRISHVVTIPYFPWQKELSWSLHMVSTSSANTCSEEFRRRGFRPSVRAWLVAWL